MRRAAREITPDSHVIDDLGLDSIAFLDTCYALDVKLNIKIPFRAVGERNQRRQIRFEGSIQNAKSRCRDRQMRS